MTKNQENLTKSRDTHQVEDKPKRRQFSPEYKKKILTELEQTQGKRGAVGEILRREGLYATQVATWKSELEDGIAGLWSKKRGPKPNTEAALRKKIEKLEKRNAMLERTSGLTIHSDRGSPMTAADTVELIGLLGLSQSLARPRTSDDNAFSEAQFKTLKYHRYFKAWYESPEDASECLQKFFGWYNTEHRHINLGLMTPETVHQGKDKSVAKKRAAVLKQAFEAYPERFPKSGPRLPVPADSVGINVPVVRKSIPVLG